MTEKHERQLREVHKKNKTHGLAHTPIYFVWAQILQRCNNENSPQYKNYGQRGIWVCKDWIQFEAFHEWAIKNGYNAGLTIERINNEDGYYPENCRWATQKDQCNNHRRNRVIQYKGEEKTLSQWCEFFNIPHSRAYDRLYRENWSVEKTFETPLMKINDKKTQWRSKKSSASKIAEAGAGSI